MTTVEELKADYDWQEAFKVATVEPVLLGIEVDLSPITVEDVAEILALDDGENDGADWIGIFKLKDKRWISIAAWCDYTGWG